jgi:SEC-C motif-containing protein
LQDLLTRRNPLQEIETLTMTASVICPCGSGKAYVHCCGHYLDADLHPTTAEALMRSRYVAYGQARTAYLQRTWHASTRPANLVLADHAATKWQGLAIVHIEAGGPGDETGVVEFVARYKVAGKATRLHEVSRFVKQDGQWFYLDGDIDTRR